MELDRIEKLLEKYLEATTTVAEEEIVRDYFANEDIPGHLKSYAPMFHYFSAAKEERFTKQMLPKPKRQRGYLAWASIAAAAVLVFGIYFGTVYYNQQEQKKAEFAYQETKKALSLLAANFERGTEKVAYLKEFEATKEKIYNKN
ncbi:hypothetical protein [Arenibacter certesii]|uniref:Uncharacterized protein n=1 Tax=Arenibacter certesii TaxID=228955 RepID=A0A918J056_9FLAO|nr:hypothetical protein [Arenibacter certesii]GGW40584.1 hypothetical protein GCM10007383_26680 [Arenibacter certesii]